MNDPDAELSTARAKRFHNFTRVEIPLLEGEWVDEAECEEEDGSFVEHRPDREQ